VQTSDNTYAGTYQVEYQLAYFDSLVPDAIFHYDLTIHPNCNNLMPTFSQLPTPLNYYLT
jgi:hypothetical protein